MFRLAFLILLLLLFAAPVVALVVIVEQRPIVAEVPPPGVRDAGRARMLLSWYKRQVTSGAERAVLSATERDLNTLAAFAGRGIPGLRARAEIRTEGLEVKASYRLPRALGGGFVNGRAIFPPTNGPLRLSQLALGPFPLPEGLVMSGVRFGLNQLLGGERGAELMKSVHGLKLRPKVASLAVRPSPGLEAELKQGLARAVALSDPAAVRVYYARLVELTGGARQGGKTSLGHYLAPLFQLARERSGSPRSGRRAIAENRAVTLALAMYFGHWRVERLIGQVRTGALAGHRPRTAGVGLAGRRDLMQHFLISATLEFAAGSGMAFAAGEFKELLDSGRGGSGFSFADLAADRAGIRFAQAAAGSGRDALKLQDLLAGGARENAFFPSLSGLPEWLNEGAFERRFGSVGSPAYLKLVEEIDRRIASRPAYRGG